MSSRVTWWCSSFRLIKLTCEYPTQTVAVVNLCQIVKHVKWDRLNVSSRLVSQMEVHCEHSRFRVLVDGQQLFDFNHRVMSLRDIDTLWIKGSVTITKLAWRRQCWTVEVLTRTRLNTSWYQVFGTGTGDKRVFHDLVLYLFLMFHVDLRKGFSVSVFLYCR